MEQRPSIRLQSGNHWYYDRPEENIFTVQDIAHNLCKEPRYNGSTDGFLPYTVGQHAVNVSYLLDSQYAFEGLHHDDAEAFYKDMTTHLKRRLPDYKRELKIGEDVIARYHGLPLEMSDAVKAADLEILKVEKLALFSGYEEDEGFEHLASINTEVAEALIAEGIIDLEPWHPRYTYGRYLQRHEELLNVRANLSSAA
jgi:hypothetical protein